MAILKTQIDEHASLGMDDTKEFSIDTESHMIVQILRDKIYSNKVAAVCREVMSNGRDANREAGRPGTPVYVSIHDDSDLIGDGSTLISFKDSGIGISPDRIDNVFLKYGGSTKRGTNGQTGGFGIGAKTPFAYTNTFIITTIAEVDGKNMKYLYQAAIISDGQKESSQLILISEEETDEKTGTTITVPIGSADSEFNLRERVAQFEWECVHAVAMWETKPEFKGFKHETKDRNKIKVLMEGENWKIVEDVNHVLGCRYDICAAVDGIPYTIEHDKIKDAAKQRKLNNFFGRYDNLVPVLMIDTGAVTLSASREDVEYIPENLDLFIEVFEKMKSELKGRAKELLANEKTRIGKAEIVNMISSGANGSTDLEKSCKTFSSVLGDLKNSLLTPAENLIIPLTYRQMAKTHNFIRVNLNRTTDQERITGRGVSKKTLKADPIFYRESNSCARRNKTLLREGHTHMIIIMPRKDGVKYLADEEAKQNIKELLAEIDVELKMYHDVERVTLPKSERAASTKLRKESINVPVKRLNYSGSESVTIECERGADKKPSGRIVPEALGNIDVSKTFLLDLNSVSTVKGGQRRLTSLFSDGGTPYSTPDFIEEYEYQEKSWVFSTLRSEGYQFLAVSTSKLHYFAKEKFLKAKDINKALEKIIKVKEFKVAVQDIINYNASSEIDIDDYIEDIYEENPKYLQLGGVDIREIEKAKKVIDYEMNDSSDNIYRNYSSQSINKIAEKLKLTPKDFGIKVTSADIEKAFELVKKEYPLIHYLYTKLESRYDYDTSAYTSTGGRSEGRELLIKETNKLIDIELGKL